MTDPSDLTDPTRVLVDICDEILRALAPPEGTPTVIFDVGPSALSCLPTTIDIPSVLFHSALERLQKASLIERVTIWGAPGWRLTPLGTDARNHLRPPPQVNP